jgi:hypothetical protein
LNPPESKQSDAGEVVVTRSKGFDRTTGDGGYIVDGPIWMKLSDTS